MKESTAGDGAAIQRAAITGTTGVKENTSGLCWVQRGRASAGKYLDAYQKPLNRQRAFRAAGSACSVAPERDLSTCLIYLKQRMSWREGPGGG